MNLLTNAVEAIQVGVEDYVDGTRPRLLSAVRNLHAGVLLLFKESLRRRSPPGSDDVLVKARIEPRTDSQGRVIFVPVGQKTVDRQQIKNRFKSLGVTVDWGAVDSIAKVRNEVEHFYPDLKQDALKGLLSSALLIIRQFASDELGEDPKALLGQQTWDTMLEVAEVYEAERAECLTKLETVDWGSDAVEDGVKLLHCPECGSGLLHPVDVTKGPEAGLECRSCGSEVGFEWYLQAAIAESLAGEAYIAMTDGADEPYAECPECGLETYVYAEGACALCGDMPATDCARCHSTIPPSEMGFSPFCSYCAHVMSKDD